jgi:murein DD-endopeptidase MepM/ murein hydrolase activator NlpD
MADNYAEYINENLNWLSNYLNHLADFDKQYRQAVYNLCNGKTDDVEKSDETLEYEQEMQEAYDNAKRLYNDLKLIAQKYNSRMNVQWDLESFHRRLTMTKLPVYERATLKMTTTERHQANGYLTGLAADVYDNYLTDEERKILDDYMQGNSVTENNEITPVLQGGLQYNHYTEQEDNDYYVENEIDGDEGYSGDSMELAAEYKRKYDEEQKQKALEQAQQNVSYQTTPQQSSANWIMPCQRKIVGKYGEPRATHIHNGIDIAVPIGTPIRAVADGIIVEARNADGYGKFVVIEHNKNGKIITSEYGHISSWTVIKGQQVKQGQIIAYSGNEGVSQGPHCHLTLRTGKYQGRAIDPYTYIKY